jgi:hypothetical protein
VALNSRASDLQNTKHVVWLSDLIFDFIFFIHPTAIGHWWMMNAGTDPRAQPSFRRRQLLLHLKRRRLMGERAVAWKRRRPAAYHSAAGAENDV